MTDVSIAMEQSLADKYRRHVERGEHDQARQTMQELITLQRKAPVQVVDLEELERTHGIKRAVVEIEKRLVDEIREHERAGRIDKAREIRDKLIYIQRHDQPQVGPQMQ